MIQNILCFFGFHKFSEPTWAWDIPAVSHYWFQQCECGQRKKIEDQGEPPVYWTRNKYGVLQENLK